MKEVRDYMKDRGIMYVLGPGFGSHVYLLFLLMAMCHDIRPLCEGKRIILVPVWHFLNQRNVERGARLG